MRCLVTGGAGFIGSHLVDALIERGDEVVVIDDCSTGRFSNLPYTKTPGGGTTPKCKLVKTYIGHETFFEDWNDLDVVFHLAAKADIVPSITNPLEYHETNVNGTIAMLELAKKCKSKFIYAASSSCYGIPKNVPTSEDEPCNPQYPYALTKYVGEQYVQHWARVYKVPAISLRLFNVFGPRHRTSGVYGAVFGTFLSQLANERPITIVGDGEQKRDFVHVSDVAQAFIMAGESDRTSGIYNIGSDGCYSINYLADLLGAKTRTYIPKRPGEPDVTFADITRINRDLGWYPKVSFETGVSRMKELITEYKDAPLWDEVSIKEATKEWFTCLG